VQWLLMMTLLVGCTSAAPAIAGDLPVRPPEVPDIAVRLDDGRTLHLAALWAERPLLLTFFYRRCAGSCTPFLQAVRDAVDGAGGLGEDYTVVALSFDEADTVAGLRLQAHMLGVLDAPGWSFAVADRADVARLASALDFWYRPVAATGQYDHPSLLVGIERGRVVRALVGDPGGRGDLRGLVAELRGGFTPYYAQAAGRATRCFGYDPVSGRLQIEPGALLLAVPALSALACALLAFGVRPRAQRSSCSSVRRCAEGSMSS
jgi:cytochrome oxidase Cu insertion factor (SCO1/SenC/PrrC family)